MRKTADCCYCACAVTILNFPNNFSHILGVNFCPRTIQYPISKTELLGPLTDLYFLGVLESPGSPLSENTFLFSQNPFFRIENRGQSLIAVPNRSTIFHLSVPNRDNFHPIAYVITSDSTNQRLRRNGVATATQVTINDDWTISQFTVKRRARPRPMASC